MAFICAECYAAACEIPGCSACFCRRVLSTTYTQSSPGVTGLTCPTLSGDPVTSTNLKGWGRRAVPTKRSKLLATLTTEVTEQYTPASDG